MFLGAITPSPFKMWRGNKSPQKILQGGEAEGINYQGKGLKVRSG